MSLREKLLNTKAIRQSPVNWEEQKQHWIEAVERLYQTVTSEWFGDLIMDGLLTANYSKVAISEEEIGNYQVNKLELCTLGSCAVFEPVAKNIIGGEGRIDLFLRGEYAKGFLLILVGENDEERWHLVDKQNKRERTLLTKHSLEEILEEWLPG
jgi:hypothetical protein